MLVPPKDATPPNFTEKLLPQHLKIHESFPLYGSIFLGSKSIQCILHRVMLATTIPALIPLGRFSGCSLTVGASSFLRFTCERNDTNFPSFVVGKSGL